MKQQYIPQQRCAPLFSRRSALSLAVGCIFASGAVAAEDKIKRAQAPVSPAEESSSAGSSGFAGIEEVVVTAQKREESLQEVPIAISAIGSEELAARGLTGLASFQQGAVPSLKILPFAGSPTTLYITMRGFAQTNAAQITLESGVPVYIDDVYAGRPQGQGLDLIEVERVEVLRGPQGTLFGKNAAGGAVRLVSKKPTGEFGVRENVDFGNFGYWKNDTHIDLPAFAGVATKIDFLVTDSDGWVKNADPDEEDFGRAKSMAGRFSARWSPQDTLTVDYAGDYLDSQSTAGYNQTLTSTDPSQAWPSSAGRLDETPYPLYRPTNPETVQGHTLNIGWDATDWLTIHSISGYRKLDSLLYNTSAGAANFAVPIPGLNYLSGATVLYNVQQEQFSEELQFSGKTHQVSWVGGLYYLTDHGAQSEQTVFGLAFPGTVVDAAGLPVTLGTPVALDPPLNLGIPATDNKVENTSWAAFGQADWKPEMFDEKLTLTAGARFGNDDKKATRNAGAIYSAPSYAGNIYTVEACPCDPVEISENQFSPLGVIAYQWTGDVSTYLRYATGYRGAGVGLNSQTFNPVNSDDVISWETGVKADLFERHVRFNLATFYEDWKDPQLNVQTVSSSAVEYFNGPDQRITGVEVDLSILPIDDLQINLAFAGYEGVRPVAENPYENTAAVGDETTSSAIVQLPARSGSVSVLYDFLHAGYGTWKLNVDGSGSSSYNTVPVANPVAGYWLWNARLTLADIKLGPKDGGLSVSLWGKNLFDKEYQVFKYQVPGRPADTDNNPATPPQTTFTEQAVFGLPRTYGLSLNYRF